MSLQSNGIWGGMAAKTLTLGTAIEKKKNLK